MNILKRGAIAVQAIQLLRKDPHLAEVHAAYAKCMNTYFSEMPLSLIMSGPERSEGEVTSLLFRGLTYYRWQERNFVSNPECTGACNECGMHFRMFIIPAKPKSPVIYVVERTVPYGTGTAEDLFYVSIRDLQIEGRLATVDEIATVHESVHPVHADA